MVTVTPILSEGVVEIRGDAFRSVVSGYYYIPIEEYRREMGGGSWEGLTPALGCNASSPYSNGQMAAQSQIDMIKQEGIMMSNPYIACCDPYETTPKPKQIDDPVEIQVESEININLIKI